MNTISITTSQNIELEYELGSLGDRIIGRLLDNLVLLAYIIVLISIIGFGNFGRFVQNNVWLVLILLIPLIFYYLLSEMFLNGQSLGKKVMGIKVMSLSGDRPSFRQYLIRWLFRIIDFSFFGLVALIVVAVSEKKQRLGDLVAGTVLVKTNPRIQIADTIFQAHGDDYQVTYPEVINLKDKDIQLIKEILKSVNHGGNSMLAYKAQQKVEKVLNIINRHQDSKTFLNAVITDYNYLTSRL
jgi:uncharacterized RDD family membrane protein YckC